MINLIFFYIFSVLSKESKLSNFAFLENELEKNFILHMEDAMFLDCTVDYGIFDNLQQNDRFLNFSFHFLYFIIFFHKNVKVIFIFILLYVTKVHIRNLFHS